MRKSALASLSLTPTNFILLPSENNVTKNVGIIQKVLDRGLSPYLPISPFPNLKWPLKGKEVIMKD